MYIYFSKNLFRFIKLECNKGRLKQQKENNAYWIICFFLFKPSLSDSYKV